MKKILILGGSGILSTAVCQEALNRGYDVTCVTRGTRDFALPKGCKSVHGDVNKIELFINNLDDYYDAILDFLTLNLNQLKYKLDFFSQATGQYFFVSSATAYKIVDEEISETTPLGNLFWDYGENKVICENYLRNTSFENMKYTIIRPYVTYGNTRLPFAIIPSGQSWSLANRILCKKPILLWDDGQAVCTLTHTDDFAKGFVDLIGNPAAYNEAFHITSNERIKWKKALEVLASALNKEPIIFSASSKKIVELLPEYEGILFGDKARNRIFDNRKIMNVAPSFNNFKPFSQGISETVDYFLRNKHERKINYIWDGRIDHTIIKIAQSNSIKIDKRKLCFASSEKSVGIKERIKYCVGRYEFLYILYSLYKKRNETLSIIKKRLKRKNEIDANQFYKLGIKCRIGKCDFGNDSQLISIGDNVSLSDGIKFINYSPTAEHFDKVIGEGLNKNIRDIGSIKIENNVFIGSNAILFPNVVIGENSYVMAGSVVMESIPPNSVACGNPAKIVCSINDWYERIKSVNEEYPWYYKELSHDKIVRERKKYFFEG